MDKYLILLGMMLLASLSFAGEIPVVNWMQYVEGRYACMVFYDGGLFQLASTDGEGSCRMGTEDQRNQMLTIWSMGEGNTIVKYFEGMAVDSGCSGKPNQLAFRSDMLGFNMLNAQFRGIFLSALRSCLAGEDECTCDRGEIVALMNTIRTNYMTCISIPGCRYLG